MLNKKSKREMEDKIENENRKFSVKTFYKERERTIFDNE